jgi:hypothetical protein
VRFVCGNYFSIQQTIPKDNEQEIHIERSCVTTFGILEFFYGEKKVF